MLWIFLLTNCKLSLSLLKFSLSTRLELDEIDLRFWLMKKVSTVWRSGLFGSMVFSRAVGSFSYFLLMKKSSIVLVAI